MTRAIVFGTSMTALLQGVLLGVGFAIAGLPSPVVFGVLGGAVVACFPSAARPSCGCPRRSGCFINGRWGYAIFMLVWGLMLAGIDNVVRPMLISGRARFRRLAVFVGVLGGIPAFGAIGIIVGPVVLSLVLALIEFAEEVIAPRRA